MVTKTYRYFWKGYRSSSALGLLCLTPFKFTLLFKHYSELFELLVLFEQLILTLNAIFATLSIAKYTEKDL